MKKYASLIIVVTLIALWPFFRKGFFTSFDGEWMIIRFSAFHQTLKTGQFPVRFVDRLNNNYGYPVLNFLYPLPFYLSEIPKLTGIGFAQSVKITFILTTLLSTLLMYWALSQKYSQVASLIGSIIYLFAPYRFVDLYVRGSLGECTAFALIPLVLGCIFKISSGKKIYSVILSLATALLILAHNVIAFIFLPLFVLLAFFFIEKDFIKILLYFLLGVLLSAFFWFPAIYDLMFVRLSQIKVSQPADHLVPISKLIYSHWGYGPVPGQSNGFSAQIGLISVLIVALAIYLKFVKKDETKYVSFLLLIFLSSTFLISELAKNIWQSVPYIDIVQFPWRILSVTVFATSILSAYIVQKIGSNAFGFLLALLAILLSVFYTKPVGFVDRQDSYYSTNEDTTTVKDEYMPLWVSEKLPRAKEKLQLPDGAQILQEDIKAASYKFTLFADKDSEAVINTIYYPGFSATIDKKSVPIGYQNKSGLITFQLPKGIHEAIIEYSKSPVHLASEIVSLLSGMLAGILFVNSWRKQKF